MKVKLSKGFQTQLSRAKHDGVIAMPEISKLRKAAIREIDKGDRLDATRAYAQAFQQLDGAPKNQAAARFLETVREEFKDRVKGEALAVKLRDFFGKHESRLPAELARVIDVTHQAAFRVSATGGQGTGARELSLEVPTRGNVPDGFARKLMDWLGKQPELKATAKELKATQWGGVQLWVRASLDPNKLGWATEDAKHAFEQIQHPGSQRGANITADELGDVLQALYNVNILPDGERNTPEWKQAVKDFVAGFKKAEAAGRVTPEVRQRFDELAALYKMPV